MKMEKGISWLGKIVASEEIIATIVVLYVLVSFMAFIFAGNKKASTEKGAISK